MPATQIACCCPSQCFWSPKLSTQVSKVVKVLSRIVSSRQTRRNDGYIAANTSLTNDAPVDDVFAASSDDLENSKMSLPPRYRFRDLLLGDFAFTDDGQRWVTSIYAAICYHVHPNLYLHPSIMHRALHCGFHCLAVPRRPLIGTAPDVPCQISSWLPPERQSSVSSWAFRASVERFIRPRRRIRHGIKLFQQSQKQKVNQIVHVNVTGNTLWVSSISRLGWALKFNSYLAHAYRFSSDGNTWSGALA